MRFHNLFLALQITSEAKAHVADLQAALSREGGFTGRRVSPDRLHISLRSLGRHDEVTARLVARTATALADVTMPPFVVALNRVMGWKGLEGRQPLVLTGDDGLIGIEMLLDQVNACLSEAGILGPPKSPPIPHMTLLYGDVVGFDRIIEPIKWVVGEFVLVDSHFGANRHVVLFRHPLGEAPAATVAA